MLQTDRPFWWPDARGFVAAAVIAMAAVALFWRMSHPSNVDDKMLDTMITILFSTAFVAIINFLFGSSKGSDSKDGIIASQLPPAAAPVSARRPDPTVDQAST